MWDADVIWELLLGAVGGGTISTQTVGKYVDQGRSFIFANQRI